LPLSLPVGAGHGEGGGGDDGGWSVVGGFEGGAVTFQSNVAVFHA
jgi:hypothetical protein